MRIMTNREAQALKKNRYFTGKPCKHGHRCERYVGSCICIECGRQANRRAAREKEGLPAVPVTRGELNKLRLQWRKEWEKELRDGGRAQHEQWMARREAEKAAQEAERQIKRELRHDHMLKTLSKEQLDLLS